MDDLFIDISVGVCDISIIFTAAETKILNGNIDKSVIFYLAIV